MRKRLLLVEDEPAIALPLAFLLEEEGFKVKTVGDGVAALKEFARKEPDLILLDVMLPEMSGVEVCQRIRLTSEVPIIMLTARAAEVDKVVGLEVGADDYVTKPFSVRELLGRVRAQLRRLARPAVSGEAVAQFGEVRVDLARRSVERSGVPVHLTPIEYRLLTSLLAQPDRVLTHRQLLQAVWGPGHSEDTHYMRVHMANLRKKLEADPARPRHLKTEAGIGYRFVGA